MPPDEIVVTLSFNTYFTLLCVYSSILTDNNDQWDTAQAESNGRHQHQLPSSAATTPVADNVPVTNAPGTEGSADTAIPLIDIGLATIHSAVEQLFDTGSTGDSITDPTSAEVVHTLEAPPFRSSDDNTIDAASTVSVDGDNEAQPATGDLHLPNAEATLYAPAAGDGAFVLLDAVSTNSGING